MVFLFLAGGPSQVDTFDPKPLLNKLDGQKRPESFGEAKYQFVNGESRLLGTKRTFQAVRQERHRSLGPVPASGAMHRRHRRHPLLLRRHGGPLGGAIPAVLRPRDPGFPEHGLVDPLRAWAPNRNRSRLCRHARSAGRSRSRRAYVFERLSACGLSAHHVPPGRQAGAESGHAEGHVRRDAPENAGHLQGLEPGATCRPRDDELSARLDVLRPRLQDADGGARGLRSLDGVRRRRSTCTASARSRPTITAAAAC